ncbi:MAG: DUF2442 domain-containing protein [Syntrophobacteraceae bacterium]
MKSRMPERPISEAEVSNISKHGLRILLGEEELFLPFKDFPWFEAAPVPAILRLEMLGSEHLYWPDLDVDLTVESIKHPEKYPLASKLMPEKLIKPINDL